MRKKERNSEDVRVKTLVPRFLIGARRVVGVIPQYIVDQFHQLTQSGKVRLDWRERGQVLSRISLLHLSPRSTHIDETVHEIVLVHHVLDRLRPVHGNQEPYPP